MYCTLPDVLHAAVFWRINKEVSVLQCESIFHPVSEYYCMKCGKPVNETEEYCSECRHRERKFIRGRSVFLYNAQMKNSLLRYKYYGSREYGKYYAESMCRYVGRDIKSWRPGRNAFRCRFTGAKRE